MPKEYRTIQEVAGPLMLVKDVEGVTYDELGEIELVNGETRRCKVLEVNGSNALTYGDKLSKLSFSSVTFVEADTDTEVKGTLEWADPDCIPTAGTTQAGWVFKPDDSKYYEDLTGTAAITVARATPAVVTVPAVAVSSS